jgi:uroporphyrinogen decarboxylase
MEMNRHLLIPGLERIEAEPDCTGFMEVLRGRGKPGELRFVELYTDVEVQEAILGRPLGGWGDRAELRLRLGYDTVVFRVEPRIRYAEDAVDDTAELSKGTRHWIGRVSALKTREDYESYPWPEEDPTIPAQLEAAATAMPEGMGIELQLRGVLQHVMGIMGYETMCQAIFDEPDLVRAVFDRVGQVIYRVFEQGMGCDRVIGGFIGDDMGFKNSTLISPPQLRQLVLPWHKKVADLCHAHGKPCVLHSCGNVAAVMDDVIDYAGIDAKHSIEDVITPVIEFKKRWGDRITVLGGVDVDMLTRSTPEEVAAYTRGIIEACAPGGRYALGSGNSIANYVPVENYLAMLREGWRYRLASAKGSA